jgi:hypothetical protein
LLYPEISFSQEHIQQQEEVRVLTDVSRKKDCKWTNSTGLRHPQANALALKTNRRDSHEREATQSADKASTYLIFHNTHSAPNISIPLGILPILSHIPINPLAT